MTTLYYDKKELYSLALAPTLDSQDWIFERAGIDLDELDENGNRRWDCSKFEVLYDVSCGKCGYEWTTDDYWDECPQCILYADNRSKY